MKLSSLGSFTKLSKFEANILININISNQEIGKKPALFNLGFRPFFLGAGLFAVISIAWWMLVYFSYVSISARNISISQWHAHEMLYGFGMAVVAGFLLTAVRNWTSIPTVFGKRLFLLFMLWCIARVLFLFGTAFLPIAAATDLLFGLSLIIAITVPIIQAKQWKQLAVVSKVALLWTGNVVFYLGCFGVMHNGMLYAINGSVLLFISLILMISRRIIPFFIERGVESKVQLKQYKWLDISILFIFLALFIDAIFLQIASLGAYLAWILFTLNGYRLLNWHATGIWKVPLLWSLYLSAWMINFGFLLYGLQVQNGAMSVWALHLFTIGGIGLMTFSMMARVSLGHTGRDVRNPSRWMSVAFLGIVASVIFRVLGPMISMEYYTSWILIAAVLWILSFAIFVIIYAPILLTPRIDGTFG